MSDKRYSARVLALDCFGDAIIQLPDDLIEELDWRVGDLLDYKMEDKNVVITNLTKNERSLKK